MNDHGARTGRRTLASTTWLLLLAGLSCKYNVTLPWIPNDASAHVPDTSFDQSLPSPPDLSTSKPDGFVCPGNNTRELPATRIPGQIVVAIDRSASMLQKNFDSGTKTLAAWTALNYASEHHPLITFQTMWFPGLACPASTCCANISWFAGGRGLDGYGSCGAFDAGCAPVSNDSPSHQALKLANDSLTTYWAWSSALVLITDQDPSCAVDSTTDSEACNLAISHATALVGQDFRIFVVVPTIEGRGPTPECLNKIANKNAPKFPDFQPPIPVKTSQDLSLRLESIVSGVEDSLCGFSLKERVEPDQIEQIRIGGRFIPRDDTGQKGWRFAPGGLGPIELSQEECNTIGSQKVTAVVCYSGHGPAPNGP